MALFDLISSSGGGGGAPSGNAGGDLGGTYPNPTVISITGATGTINVASTGNVITWDKATTAPGLTQTAPTSDVAPADMHLTPQPSYVSAVTNTRGGSAVINLTTLAGTGSPHAGKGTFRIVDVTNANSSLFEVASAAFNGNGWSTTYFGSGGAAYITSGGAAIQMNGNGANTLSYASSTMIGWGASGVSLLSNGSYGGGSGVISIAVATTAPTSNPASNGFILFVDPADSKLKARGSSGTVTTLAVP